MSQTLGRAFVNRFMTMATFPVPWRIGEDVDDCEQFIAAQQAPLLRAAYLLTGNSSGAQDLVQETLIRVVDKWRQVRSADSPHAYTRKIMLREFQRGHRRRWNDELPHAEVPERDADARYDAVDDRDRIRRALLHLPPRQRAAVVLRHYEDRSEAETAELLGCRLGTIKSLTSRGLSSLREHLTMTDQHCEQGQP